MWLIVFFDLPMDGYGKRKQYTQFRSILFREGFSALQKSVYAGNFKDAESCEASEKRLKARMPNIGIVTFLQLSDSNFSRMRIFRDASPVKPQNGIPENLII